MQPEIGETCDDGDAADGDGCDAECALEDGFACRDEPSECYAFACGDGLFEPGVGEACDDGNLTPGDGCDGACALEEGAYCYGDPSVCLYPVCGDGVIDSGEGCEDGNRTPGDGCDERCRVELPPPGSSRILADAFTGSEPRFAGPGPSRTRCSTSEGLPAPFRAYALTNASATDVVIDVFAASAVPGSLLYVYEGYFDPDDPTDRCSYADTHDSTFGPPDGPGSDRVQIRGVPVGAGQTVVVVKSSNNSTDLAGAYTLTVTTR